MLILSRKPNETIVIDGNIRITVVGIRGNQIRLGIEAPGSVGVFREELCLPIPAGEGCERPSAATMPKRQAPASAPAARDQAPSPVGMTTQAKTARRLPSPIRSTISGPIACRPEDRDRTRAVARPTTVGKPMIARPGPASTTAAVEPMPMLSLL